MDTSSHTMAALFAQLGLPNSEIAMDNFMQNNHLPMAILLENAAFWSAGQAQFIREAISQDARGCWDQACSGWRKFCV